MDEPVADEPVADEPVVVEPVAEEPVAEEPVADEPATDESVVVEPVAEEPVADEPVTDEPVVDEPVAAERVAAEPEPVDAALVAEVESAFAAEDAPAADWLERIEGIGPKIAAALRAAGITTYAQLAAADRADLEDALERANLRFAPSIGTWSQQARLLADADEDGFKALTGRLIAGRDVPAKTAVGQPVAVEPLAAEPVVEESPAAEPVVDEPVAVEPVAAEPVVEEPLAAEPVVDEPVVEEPASVAEEPAPVVEEPVAVEPEPVVVEPAQVAVTPEPVAAVAEPVVDEPSPAVIPAQAAAVEDVEPDNLQRIEGIGPKMSAALIAGGIRTYRQLADTDVDTLRAKIEAAGLRFAPSLVTWARQAAHLADGDEDGFADLTRRLVAGRDTGRA